VTSQHFAPERTGAAGLPCVTHDLQRAARRLKQTSDGFSLLLLWKGRQGQRLTPLCYSWGSNASHSSSGAPGDWVILESTKETGEMVAES